MSDGGGAVMIGLHLINIIKGPGNWPLNGVKKSSHFIQKLITFCPFGVTLA